MICQDITLSPDQQRAADAILQWWHGSKRCFALGGLAGTGKSTITGIIADQIGVASRTIYSAPTGRASAVLRAKGLNSWTLHSLLYRVKGTVTDDDGRESPIFENKPWEQFAELLVVDEASMVTTRLFNDILDRDIRVLFVGDHGQLAPVGGNPRIMEKAKVRLERIHRQAEGSGILRAAHAVRAGQRIGREFACDDVAVGRVRSIEHAVRVAKDYAIDQTIVATNAERHRFNRFWRNGSIGPPEVGERLACLNNNRDLDIWNGQSFVVRAVRRVGKDTGIYDLASEDDGSLRRAVSIFLPGLTDPDYERREYLENGANLFAFAYALTAHKMQGSQRGRVMVLDRPISEPARWSYTGYTRAEDFLMIAKYS